MCRMTTHTYTLTSIVFFIVTHSLTAKEGGSSSSSTKEMKECVVNSERVRDDSHRSRCSKHSRTHTHTAFKFRSRFTGIFSLSSHTVQHHKWFYSKQYTSTKQASKLFYSCRQHTYVKSVLFRWVALHTQAHRNTHTFIASSSHQHFTSTIKISIHL